MYLTSAFGANLAVLAFYGINNLRRRNIRRESESHPLRHISSGVGCRKTPDFEGNPVIPLQPDKAPLFQISAHDADKIVHCLFGRLAVPWHVVANVVFHEFAHEAVDGSPCGGESLKDIGALFVVV